MRILRYNINVANLIHRGIAQLVEQWSPKPRAVGSSPTAPVKAKTVPIRCGFCFVRSSRT